MLILSLDPSLSSTGYAIIESGNKGLITKGKINTSPKYSTDDRIQSIVKELEMISSIYLPNGDIISCVILEDGYIGMNKGTSQKLCELRGALIFYYKYNKIPVYHKQPSEIRKNFGLPGNATKERVAEEVLKFYPELEREIGKYSDKQNKNKTSDIYDAISIGLSYLKVEEEA